jgi:hypothetical protein
MGGVLVFSRFIFIFLSKSYWRVFHTHQRVVGVRALQVARVTPPGGQI